MIANSQESHRWAATAATMRLLLLSKSPPDSKPLMEGQELKTTHTIFHLIHCKSQIIELKHTNDIRSHTVLKCSHSDSDGTQHPVTSTRESQHSNTIQRVLAKHSQLHTGCVETIHSQNVSCWWRRYVQLLIVDLTQRSSIANNG